MSDHQLNKREKFEDWVRKELSAIHGELAAQKKILDIEVRSIRTFTESVNEVLRRDVPVDTER